MTYVTKNNYINEQDMNTYILFFLITFLCVADISFSEEIVDISGNYEVPKTSSEFVSETMYEDLELGDYPKDKSKNKEDSLTNKIFTTLSSVELSNIGVKGYIESELQDFNSNLRTRSILERNVRSLVKETGDVGKNVNLAFEAGEATAHKVIDLATDVTESYATSTVMSTMTSKIDGLINSDEVKKGVASWFY